MNELGVVYTMDDSELETIVQKLMGWTEYKSAMDGDRGFHDNDGFVDTGDEGDFDPEEWIEDDGWYVGGFDANIAVQWLASIGELPYNARILIEGA